MEQPFGETVVRSVTWPWVLAAPLPKAKVRSEPRIEPWCIVEARHSCGLLTRGLPGDPESITPFILR